MASDPGECGSRRVRLALLSALLATSCTGDRVEDSAARSNGHRSGSALVAPLPRAPEAPPAASLAGGHAVQRGTLVHYQWVRSGASVEYEPPAVPKWPRRLPIRSKGEPLLLLLDTPIEPDILRMRSYARIDQDGLPAGRPQSLYCEVTFETGCGQSTDGEFAWEVNLPPARGSARFLVATAIWFGVPDNGEVAVRPHVASWWFWVSD